MGRSLKTQYYQLYQSNSQLPDHAFQDIITSYETEF